MAMKSILVLTPDSETITTLKQAFGDRFEIEAVLSLHECLIRFAKKRRELTFIEISYLTEAAGGGLTSVEHFKEVLGQFRELFVTAPLLVMGPPSESKNLARSVQAGANRFLSTPLEPEALLLATDLLKQSQLQESELDYLRRHVWLV